MKGNTLGDNLPDNIKDALAAVAEAFIGDARLDIVTPKPLEYFVKIGNDQPMTNFNADYAQGESRTAVTMNQDVYDSMVAEIAYLKEAFTAFRAAYEALNKPSTDLQTRLDIAGSLKKFIE